MSRDHLSVLARRWLLVALALVVVLTLAALLWTAAPWAPHSYIATQTLRIVVLPADDGGAYTASDAQNQEDVIARDLASDALLSSNTFVSTVLRTLPPGASTGAILHDLRASHTDNLVTLTASAGSVHTASVLASAAGHALSVIGAASPLPGGDLDRASVWVEVGASTGSVAVDVGAERAQAGVIVTKGASAALAILIVLAALAAAGARRSEDEGARQPDRRAVASGEP